MIGEVIYFYYPGVEFTCGETYESLNWISQAIPKPSKEDVEALVATYETDSTKDKNRKKVLSEIQKLETKTYRPLREIILNFEVEENKSRLAEIETQIQTLRSQL